MTQNDALATLKEQIRRWSRELGFDDVGITDTDPGEHGARLDAWLAAGYAGEMSWLARHRDLRLDPAALQPGTLRVISLRMNYLPDGPRPTLEELASDTPYVARYARGRDYHKVIRRRLATLLARIEAWAQANDLPWGGARVFTDSAPLLEKAFAEKAGIGWLGKNTLLLTRDAGSWFFLGEVCIGLPLPVDAPYDGGHCGSCTACMDVCPTGAFVGPYELDASRCIAYLTIEHKGAIDPDLRPLMGTRVFGCDDCQIVCPWNRAAPAATEPDFAPRAALTTGTLLDLFAWTEDEFLERTAGTAIRRTGYEGWQRNLAIGLGNSAYDPTVVAALIARRGASSAMVVEHIDWAIAAQEARAEH